MPSLLLATCATLPEGDEDAGLLDAALADAGVDARWAVWDDPAVEWSAAPVLLRSTWDYSPRRQVFLAWVSGLTTVWNPADVVRWSSEKTYLLDLADAGVPVTPTSVVRAGEEPALPADREFVVKPSVGAGSRGAARFAPGEHARAAEHVRELLAAGRTPLVQPYFDGVDTAGETALVFVDGVFSHAVRKGPLLQPGTVHPVDHSSGLWVAENITAREPSPAELAVARRALDAVTARFGQVPLYARVDLLPGPQGPVVVELELVEPSLFLAHAPDAAGGFARAVAGRLAVRA